MGWLPVGWVPLGRLPMGLSRAEAGPPAPLARRDPSSSGMRGEGLTVYVSAMAAAGAVVLALALQQISAARPAPPPWLALVFVAVFALADSRILALRFGVSEHMFTWSEAAVVVGLVMLPWPWLVVTAACGVPIGYLASRAAPVKVLFNTAGIIVGLFLAARVFAAAGGHVRHFDSLEFHTAGATVLACLAFFVWNGLTVAFAVALSQRMPFWSVYRRGLALSVFVWAGNTLSGIFVVAIAVTAPEMLVFAPPMLALLAYSYRSSLRARTERDIWRRLEAASREISHLQTDDMARAVLERAADLSRGDVAELALLNHSTTAGPVPPAPQSRSGPTVYRCADGETTSEVLADPARAALGFWPRLASERATRIVDVKTATPEEAAHLKRLCLQACLVTPLLAGDECIGALAFGFRHRADVTDRDLQVLTTFANQVATAAENARLFEEIGEEHARLARIVEGSSDGIVALDTDGLVSVWNPAMVDVTGTPAKRAKGRPLPDVLDAVTEEGVPWNARAWVDALTPGERTTMVVVNGAGGPRHLHLSAGRLATTSGRPQTTVLIARDMTSVLELEQAKQDFVATVSHELRTPVTCLRGFVDTMLRPEFPLDRAMVDDHLLRMRRQAQRLDRLVEDVLDVSLIERGELLFSVEPVCISDVVDRVVEDSGLLGTDRDVRVAPESADATVWVDPLRIEQVLTNLVSNACRYSPPDSPVEIGVAPGNQEVTVFVRDRGPGIPPEHHETVFERFSRLGSHLNRSQGGAGLGLYIARRIVQSMGGRIWVESDEGAGAVFRFTIPTVPATAAAPSSVGR